MQPFVNYDSIVRKIWGKSDTVLFIFAGASAEFALNKAVDWLYFTGKLPSDPIGRLFSTVAYARRIVFTPMEEAHKAIDVLRQIHSTVEQNRGFAIPDQAYRDVLFMLIHYSIAAFETLERRLTEAEKQEVYDVFYRVGSRMGLKELPASYPDWLPVRTSHLQKNLQESRYTSDLFRQYRRHLGIIRYFLLIEVQKLVVPPHVRALLKRSKFSVLKVLLPLYKLCRNLKLDQVVKNIFLPRAYKQQIMELDVR